MIKGTEDRRVRKTKKQLRTALTTLLLEKDISRITVRDVAELADVNRGTFYAHYSDVNDLLAQLESDLLDEIVRLGKNHDPHRTDGKTFPYLTGFFTIAGEYSDVFYSVFCRCGDMAFQQKLFELLKKQYLTEFLLLNGIDGSQIDYCASFIVSAVCMLTKRWIENGRPETPEELAALGGKWVVRGICSAN